MYCDLIQSPAKDLIADSENCLGYDPDGAITFWKRMTKAEQFAPPQFVSTHPSSENRILAIQKWLPQAQEARAASDCGNTIGYANAFSKSFQSDPFRRQPARRPVPVQEPPRRDDDDDDFW